MNTSKCAQQIYILQEELMSSITMQMVQQVLKAVGGHDNVIQSGNCITRLRLTLKDASKVDVNAINALEVVLDVVDAEGQCQIILGPGKAKTAADIMQQVLTQSPEELEHIEMPVQAAKKVEEKPAVVKQVAPSEVKTAELEKETTENETASKVVVEPEKPAASETKPAASNEDPMITELLSALGGAGNIIQCGNCMTRLRISLKNNDVVDTARIKAIPQAMGVIESDEQIQIIFGPGKVQKVADKMNVSLAAASTNDAPEPSADLNAIAADKKNELKKKRTSGVQQFLSKFATIFTPLIPGFIAAGLMLGIATLIEQSFLLGNDNPNALLLSVVAYMKVFGKGLFSFLSILIGYNGQKAFGGSGVNGAIIASLFVLGYNPEATTGIYSGMNDFFGMAIDPRGNIIGVLIASIVGAWVEKRVRKLVPENLDMILTSMITLLIMGAFTFTVIMPIGGVLFKGMSWLFINLNGNPFGSAILAGLFLIAVMFGIHQGFVPVYFALMETQGFNSLFPILAMAGGGLVGASFALYFKAKPDSVTRTQIKGAIVPGILGIGEPLIYGVTLPRVKPFITACIGGAAGGFFIGLVSYMGLPIGLNTIFGPSGVVAIPLMTSNAGIFQAMLVALVGLMISYVVSFIVTWFFGTKNVDLS